MQAALRVPDHGGLTPWRFIVCEGKALHKLGSLFELSAIENDKSEKEILRASQLPMRAPMIIIAIATYKIHDKVPRIEQIASASCAVMAMQMAALAQGYNGMWRTGSFAHCDTVRNGLDLAAEDELVGFLYLGTPKTDVGERQGLDPDDFFTFW
jgi:nitroreductase